MIIERDKDKVIKLLDAQDSIVVLSSEQNIGVVNQKFLEFFNITKLDDFTKENNCLCDKFEFEEGKNFIQKIYKSMNWKDYVKSTPNEIHRVKIKDANDKYREKEVHITELIGNENGIQIDIQEGLEKIKLLQKEITDIQKANEEKIKASEGITQDITQENEDLESMVYWNLSEIDRKIKEAVEQHGLKVKLERKGEVKSEIETVEKAIKKHNKNLDIIKDAKTQRIKESAVPVEGVTFDGETIRYKGIEFEQCSTAERIEMSIAIGIKENPKIRILLIRDGSAIGKATMEKIKQLAKKNNFQIWIERVSNTKGNEIFIEDGQIV